MRGTGLRLIDEVKTDIKSFTGDAAYDTLAIYDAGSRRGAKVVVPPFKTAVVSKRGPRSRARDRTIRRINKAGRRRWKKETGYHRQGTVENAFFRYKKIVGDQTSCTSSRRATNRSRRRVQCAEPDARTWTAKVSDRCCLNRVGWGNARRELEFCNNARICYA